MSTRNPFRASLSNNPAVSPVPQTSFINSSVPGVPEEGRAGLEDAPPSKTKKHVRIESNTTFIPPQPVSSDTDDSPLSPVGQRLGQSGYGDSINYADPATSTAGNASAVRSATDMFGRGDAMAAPDMMAGSSQGYQAPQSYTSPSGIPANPFSRTLASMEPQQNESGEGRTPAERPALGNNRASLDVESFKNMLLTGKRPSAPPAQSATLSSIPSGSQFESSSSTDTSSISRQSLFESSQQTHQESPRTSIEVAESDDDEDMGLVSEVKKGKKKPPPAPKHRHGKLVTQRQPQTVSFDSFSASAPIPPPTTRSRDNSEVNKPLPPTPVISPPALHISTQDTSQDPPPPPVIQQTSNDTLAASEVPRPQKRTPPPVPLARRQSQLRSSTAGNRSRSNSSLTISSQHSIEPPLLSPAPSSNKDPLSTAKSPPPPPRSRRGVKLADIGTSSANSSSTELPQRSTSVRTAASAQGPTSSRRSTLDSEPPSPSGDLHRTSSISSNRPSHRTVSNDSTSNSMPPPPPPPRRRNRSSLDQQRPHIPSTSSPTESRRTSTEYRRTSLENNRRTSVASESSLRREYAPIEEKETSEYALYSPNEEAEKRLGGDKPETQIDAGTESNILDDMDKFQKEIEELRSRYK